MKKTLFICLCYTFYIFFKDFTYALLIRFYDNWISSFILLPSITLIILLIPKIWKNKLNFTNLIIKKINLFFLLRILFVCICLYINAELLYGIIDKSILSKSTNDVNLLNYTAMILAATGEELFFRGYLLHYALKNTRTQNKLSKMLIYSILTSILFSIAHWRFDLFIFQYFFFSMICSLIYIKSNLFYTIFFHCFYNIMVLLCLGEFLQLEKLNTVFIIIALFSLPLLMGYQLSKLKDI